MAPEIPEVNPGEVATAAEHNFAWRRAVQRYPTSVDRDLENPTPEAGDVAFLEDVDQLMVYDGANWGSVFASRFGSSAFPAFTFEGDPDTGMYRLASNELGFATAGAERMRTRAASTFFGGLTTGYADIKHAAGAVGNPTYSFVNDTETGMYRISDDRLGFAVGGVKVADFSSGEAIFPVIYGHTTGLGADVNVFTTGSLRRSTSARRYKNNIKSAAPLADLTLEPVTFHRDDDDMDFIGFIADDIPDERGIVFNEDGEVENYDLRAVVAILAAKVNRLEAQLETLQ